MNILFLSVYEIADSNSGYIYADLVREFSKHGDKIYAVSPTKCDDEFFKDGNGVNIIRVRNGQIQKTGRIKKVINLLTLEKNTVKAVKKYASDVKFDFVVNMSSNLSYIKTAKYFKKRDGAIYYLLLKDIFPQNAVDIGMMKKNGLAGLIYKYFAKKEKKAYKTVDFIGCMSNKNREYVLKNNPSIDENKVTVVPNSIEPSDFGFTEEENRAMREKYGIPQGKTVFVYGGNLGKPQAVPFIIECLKTQENNENVFFLIVGDGTEYPKFESFMTDSKQKNVKLLKRLPREDFDTMLSSCDVGLIFLDSRFTVPNYPSRLLSYMQAGLPVYACTDINTDVGDDIVNGKFGWKSISGDLDGFVKTMEIIAGANLPEMGKNAQKYLAERFSVALSYELIMSAVRK